MDRGAVHSVPPRIVLAAGRIQIADRQSLRVGTRRGQIKVSVQFPAHTCLAKTLRPSRSAVCGISRLAGRAYGSACLWGAEDEATEAPRQTGLGEQWRPQSEGKAEGVHSGTTWRPKENRHKRFG